MTAHRAGDRPRAPRLVGATLAGEVDPGLEGDVLGSSMLATCDGLHPGQ